MANIINEIDKKINRVIFQIDSEKIGSGFHVDIKNELKEFIKFFLAAEYYQENVNNACKNVLKYANTKFPNRLKNLEFCDIDKQKVNYYNENFYDEFGNEISEDDVFIIDDEKNMISYEEEKEKNYRNILEKFHNLNHEKKRLRILNRKEYFPSDSEFHKNKFTGNDIKEFQLQELSDLMEVKIKKFLDKENKTYKRINSDKNYKKLINFKSYKEFAELLKNDIEESDYDYKALLYYKLEKRLGFEIIKYILNAVNDEGIPDKGKTTVYDDLLILIKVPLFKTREKYVDLYLSLDKDEREEWLKEIGTLMWFIQECTLETKKMIDINSIYDSIIKDYTNIKKKSSDYRTRKDFSAKDFEKFMSRIDYANEKNQLEEGLEPEQLKVLNLMTKK